MSKFYESPILKLLICMMGVLGIFLLRETNRFRFTYWLPGIMLGYLTYMIILSNDLILGVWILIPIVQMRKQSWGG